MKKLILHSDQIGTNTQVDEAFLGFFGGRKPKIAYIPSQSDVTKQYFNLKIDWYNQFGITDLFYFDIDQEFDRGKIPELLSCDAIFLSGGNTFSFLHALQKRNLIPVLRKFVKNGGILIGVSAGSIMMSKTIAIATVDGDIGGDQNTVGLEDFSALALNNFEFFPHFDSENLEIIKRLKEYSKKSGSTIYACKDGDGIIVENDDVHFIGQVQKFQNGKITLAK